MSIRITSHEVVSCINGLNDEVAKRIATNKDLLLEEFSTTLGKQALRLINERDAIESELKVAWGNREKNTTAFIKLRDEIEGLKSKLTSAADAIKKRDHYSQGYRNEISELQEVNESLKSDLTAATNSINNTTEKFGLDGIGSFTEQLSSYVDDLKKTITEQKADLDYLNEKYKEVCEENKDLSNRMSFAKSGRLAREWPYGKYDFVVTDAELAGSIAKRDLIRRMEDYSDRPDFLVFHKGNEAEYNSLYDVLMDAYNQAAHGKGAERHGNGLAFEDQPMQVISKLIGDTHGMAFQACKKVTEALKLPTHDARVRELLGAIVYVAGMVVFETERNLTGLNVDEEN